jgi:hypothetical protein
MSRNKCFCFQVRISQVLRFISICDLFTDSPSYLIAPTSVGCKSSAYDGGCQGSIPTPVMWNVVDSGRDSDFLRVRTSVSPANFYTTKKKGKVIPVTGREGP